MKDDKQRRVARMLSIAPETDKRLTWLKGKYRSRGKAVDRAVEVLEDRVRGGRS